MIVTDIMIDEQSRYVLAGSTGDRLRMELLDFWSRHPGGRFTVDAISWALDSRKRDVGRALGAMVADGLVHIYYYDGAARYSLAASEEIRSFTAS